MPNEITTTTFRAYVQGASTTVSDIDGSSTISRSMLVERIDGTILNINDESQRLLIKEGLIPPLGTAFNTTPSGHWEDTARLRSWDMQAADRGKAIVNLVYSTMYTEKPVADPTAGTPYWHLPAYAEFSSGFRPMALYYSGGTAAPKDSNASVSHIGGTAIGGARLGMQIQVPTMNIRVRFVLDATAEKIADQVTQVLGIVGKVNSDTFLNFPSNSLVCEGLSSAHLDKEYYEVIFEFSFDQYYRHSQVPQTYSDGTPITDDDGIPTDVRWQREERSSMDFNLIFSPDGTAPNIDTTLKQFVERGYWEP